MAPTTPRPLDGSTLANLDAMKAQVERRLGLELRAEDDKRHAELLAELASRLGVDANGLVDKLATVDLGVLADRLTVNETFFFRNTEHFTALRALVLPELLRAAREEGREVRVLSAGCASGEEAYSVAIALEGVGALPHEIAVTAVDISPTILERARRARFSAWSLRATPEEVCQRYFSRDGQEWVLTPRLAERVAFELGNLTDPLGTFWSRAHYDLILCRNVLMYFSAEAMNRALVRLEQALRPGGYLFLGHAESLRSRAPPNGPSGPAAAFIMQARIEHEAFFYKKLPLPLIDAPPRVGPAPAATGAAASSSPTHDEPPDPAWFEQIGRQGERIATLHAEAIRRVAENRQAALVSPPPARDEARRLASRTRLAQAVSALEAGRFDEVERLCETLIEDPDAQYLLALRREHLDDAEGAIARYQMASALDSGFAMPRVHLGIMLARLGDHDAARRAFGEAVVLLPSETDERILWFGGGFTRESLREHCRRMAQVGEVKLG